MELETSHNEKCRTEKNFKPKKKRKGKKDAKGMLVLMGI